MCTDKKKRVVYLIGAGGTHGSVNAANGSTGLLMHHLTTSLAQEARALVTSRKKYLPLAHVVNEILEDGSDFEHIITFFEESSSAIHRDLADDLRRIFEKIGDYVGKCRSGLLV